MLFRDMPIRKKLMRVIALISGVVLLVTCITFFVYEFYAFRKSTKEKLSTIGKIISANSTAALAFDNPEDAKEIMAALKTEPHIVAACLYDNKGNLFSQYISGPGDTAFPAKPGPDGYKFIQSHLEGFEPVIQEKRRLGTLYLKSNLSAMYDRFEVVAIVTAVAVVLSFLLAYLLSKILQKSISKPILSLADTAKVISDQKNYSVRAVKSGKDEVGLLTDSFNNMLDQIQQQNEALNEFTHTLEQKVSDRTTQLEAVNKELEAFSYSISHDLRAPLRIIDGYSDIIISDYKDKMDAEGNRILSIVKSNARRMGQLIDDLLNFSHIGRKEPVLHLTDMNKLVRGVIDEQFSFSDHTETIQLEQLEPAICDSSLMRQVWVNLISNAVKYSGKQARPEILIRSERKGNNMIYSVKDNGVGFDMRYAEKLFGVFQRLHGITEFEGTGIGLALVNRILARHNGKIWAESEVGKGATFFFSLPVRT